MRPHAWARICTTSRKTELLSLGGATKSARIQDSRRSMSSEGIKVEPLVLPRTMSPRSEPTVKIFVLNSHHTARAMHFLPKTKRLYPRTTADRLSVSDQLLIQTFARLDPTALGIAFGATCGLAIFLATNFLILKGGENIGQNLQLLGQYFLGYSVTLTGSVIGFAYGLIVGFVLGWSIAFTRNLFMSAYLHIIRVRTSMSSVQD